MAHPEITLDYTSGSSADTRRRDNMHADDTTIITLARAYGDAWKAFDAAGEVAEAAHSGRGNYDDNTRERLSALAHDRSCAHVKLLAALGIEVSR